MPLTRSGLRAMARSRHQRAVGDRRTAALASARQLSHVLALPTNRSRGVVDVLEALVTPGGTAPILQKFDDEPVMTTGRADRMILSCSHDIQINSHSTDGTALRVASPVDFSTDARRDSMLCVRIIVDD